MNPWTRADARWLHQRGFGVFLHYLPDAPSGTLAVELDAAAWNRQVDSVDAAALVRSVAATGAGWLFFTIGQNSGFYCAPNPVYDELVGAAPSRLAQRDLIAELAEACAASGLRFGVYLPSLAPANHALALERLCCTPPEAELAKLCGLDPTRFQVQPQADRRLSVFQRHWEAIIRHWSLTWGERVSAWWFDGCYAADALYRHDDDGPGFRSFALAAKAGNPDAVVAFNPGIKTPIICHTPYEDYTAGELDSGLAVGGWGPCADGIWRFQTPAATVDGAQLHALSFLGQFWGRGPARFDADLAAAYTRFINRSGGGMSWDVPVSADGVIADEFLRLLTACTT